MNCEEQAKRLYVIFVESASNGSLISYDEVLTLLGYGSKVSRLSIKDGLQLVWLTCVHTVLPPLTTIIVNEVTGDQ